MRRKLLSGLAILLIGCSAAHARSVKAGSTSVTNYFCMRLAATGVIATGLTATDFDLYYTRSGAAISAKVDATLNGNGVAGAWSESTVIEVGQGIYRVDFVDAAFAVGVPEVILTVNCATAFSENLRVELSPPADVVAVSGDTTAADNAELAFDGTGYGFTNCTMPTVSDATLGNHAHGGAAATLNLSGGLTLGATTITNAAGVGLVVSGSTDGATITGLAGRGVTITGTGGTNDALLLTAPGNGLYAISTGTRSGIYAQGGTTFAGITAVGGTTGHGIYGVGGGTSGTGIRGVASTIGDGIEGVGAGGGYDIHGDIEGNLSGSVGSLTVWDKTGYSLSGTGADLILKTSTFALALSDAFCDELLAGHTTANSLGKLVTDMLELLQAGR